VQPSPKWPCQAFPLRDLRMRRSEMLSRRGHDAGPLALRMDSACQARSSAGRRPGGTSCLGRWSPSPHLLTGRSLRSPGRLDYHAARKRCRFAPLFSSDRPPLSRNGLVGPADVPAPRASASQRSASSKCVLALACGVIRCASRVATHREALHKRSEAFDPDPITHLSTRCASRVDRLYTDVVLREHI
jgi:hypothetical protein